MPEPTPPPPGSPASPDQEPSSQTPIPFNIAEEFGTAKRNLPPATMVAVALAVVAIVLGAFAFLQRAKPQGGGSMDEIVCVEIPDQNSVLVAVNVTIHNTGEKPLWIHDIKATLKTDNGDFSDDAASAMDFERYFQAFPGLKEHALSALTPETKLKSGAESRGTVVVSFPVTKDAFDTRKSLTVAIQPYDQPLPLVLTK